jgi:hypothetical protein
MESTPLANSPAPRSPVIATVVLAVVTFFSAAFALMSVMLFDAPGSEHNPYLLIAFVGILSVPVLSVLAIVLAWIGYWIAKPRLTVRIVFLPLIGVALATVGFGLVSTICHGSFRC